MLPANKVVGSSLPAVFKLGLDDFQEDKINFSPDASYLACEHSLCSWEALLLP